MKVSSLKTQEPLLQNMQLPEPIMEKRIGISLVPTDDQMSSSVMKSTTTRLPFIGLCFTGLNLGRLSLHPQTRALGPSALRWIKQEHWLVFLLETGQNKPKIKTRVMLRKIIL